MSKPWRRSKSLIKLMSQLNAAYPERDTTSDGAIGDDDHQDRSSDHNPWVIDASGQPVVTAQDIDEDLASNIHSIQGVVDAICKSRDPRVKYIIYERKITVKGSNLQQWKRYEGRNAHSIHCHISVFPEQKLYDDAREWNIGITKSAAAEPVVLEIPPIEQPPPNAATEKPVENPTVPLAPPPANQTAEQITNINAGDKTVPDNFKPEDKEINAPAKENSTGKTAVVTIGGFVVPTFLVGIVTAIKSAITDGYIDARELGSVVISFIASNQKYVFAGLGLVVGGMMLKKLYKQITLWIAMYIAARPDMHNVTVKPQ